MKLVRFLVLISIFIFTANGIKAEEISFVNGDRLTGEIIKVTSEKVTVKTFVAGELDFNHVQIDTINGEETASYLSTHHTLEKEKDEAKPAVEWKRTASVGFTQSGGNTDKSQFNAQVKINRKTDDDEWTGKWNGYYATSDNTTDAKKYYGMARYANSFGETKKWYQFGKLEGDQDKFSSIQYRMTPSYGLGYWFFDEDDFKVMLEGALGYTYTKYVASSSEGEMELVPRAFIEKVVFENFRVSEDVTLYPSLEDTGEFRLHSETSLISPVTEQLSWKVSFINDYDSDPKGGADNNDYRLITGVDINF